MIYEIIVLIHVLFVMVAVGAVVVIDYLHLVGLKKRRVERRLKDIYPKLSNLVTIALIGIILTGVILVLMNPILVTKELFILKMALVAVVSINGVYLQKVVSPNLDLCILEGTKYCSSKLLYSTAISGSISIVTWLSIVVLAFTKNMGYNSKEFLIGYLVVLALAATLSFSIERRAREWRD